MTITVDTPDGGTAEFPDGTSPDTISSAMKSKFGGGATKSDAAGGFLQRAASTGTMGLSDWAGAGINAIARGTGLDPNAPTHEQIVKQNEQYGQEHPWASTAADLAGFGTTAAVLGPEQAIAGGADWLAGKAGLNLGSRALGAIGSAGTAAGADIGSHLINKGELPSTGDVMTDLTVGGGLGALIGGRARSLAPAAQRAGGEFTAAGGGLGGAKAAVKDFAGPETPSTPFSQSIDALSADKDAKYGALETMPTNPQSVGQAIQRAHSQLTPGQQAMVSPGLQAQIDRVNDIIAQPGQRLTLGDVDGFQRSIGAASNGGPGDTIASAKIGEALRALGGQPMADARQAQARLGEAQWLSGKSPAEAAAGAGARLNNAKLFYDPASRQAMQALADKAPGDFGQMAQSLIKPVVNMAGRAILGHTVGGFVGEAPLLTGLGAIEGGGEAKGMGGKAVQIYNNIAARRAYKAALAASGVSSTPPPFLFSGAPWLSQGARQMLYANKAATPSD